MKDNTFWNNDWMDIQRQYWEQWSDWQQKSMGLQQPPASPWELATDHWWKAVKQSTSPIGQEFYERMLEQGKAFFRMAENIMQSSSTEKNATDTWTQLMTSFADSFSKTSQFGNQNSGFWEMPLDNWNRMVSAMSPVPGDLLRGMGGIGGMSGMGGMTAESVKEQFSKVLGAPGLGYTRESQEQYQTLVQALQEYQETMLEYSMMFSNMGEKAVKLLQERTTDMEIDSARKLYDTWVGCCEEVYAEQVMTEQYIELHGRLVNALMLVKARWGEILNEYLSMLNIPTSDDLRTLQIRMQEQRRENKKLSSEVAKLRKVVEQLSTDQQAAAKPASPKKAASRKKATKKAAAKTNKPSS